jgi:hypothetical protein
MRSFVLWTPLHEACRRDHPKLVALLIDNNADIGAITREGETPLHLACKHARSWRKIDLPEPEAARWEREGTGWKARVYLPGPETEARNAAQSESWKREDAAAAARADAEEKRFQAKVAAFIADPTKDEADVEDLRATHHFRRAAEKRRMDQERREEIHQFRFSGSEEKRKFWLTGRPLPPVPLLSIVQRVLLRWQNLTLNGAWKQWARAAAGLRAEEYKGMLADKNERSLLQDSERRRMAAEVRRLLGPVAVPVGAVSDDENITGGADSEAPAAKTGAPDEEFVNRVNAAAEAARRNAAGAEADKDETPASMSTVEALIEAGADLRKTDVEGNSSLHVACSFGEVRPYILAALSLCFRARMFLVLLCLASAHLCVIPGFL